MNRLNYQHLLYAWMTAREGTVARAAARLCLVPSTLSSQIHDFEDDLGLKLFRRRGRTLELTEAGRIAYRYAEEIFSLGQEMQASLRGRQQEGPVRLVVGVLDTLSKPMVHRILDRALAADTNLRISCREDGSLEDFLAELATHDVDVVLSDAPARSGLPVRVFNHLLGESGTTFFAAPSIVRTLRPGFPESLDGVNMLLPGRKSEMHRALGQWFEAKGVRPRVIGEIDDSALLKLFGQMGRGVFAATSVDECDITERYRVRIIGRADVRQCLYAITGERRIRNPGVIALTECSRDGIFGPVAPRRVDARSRPRAKRAAPTTRP
jgi:LysR family transcriptional activator of nhaA